MLILTVQVLLKPNDIRCLILIQNNYKIFNIKFLIRNILCEVSINIR